MSLYFKKKDISKIEIFIFEIFLKKLLKTKKKSQK